MPFREKIGEENKVSKCCLPLRNYFDFKNRGNTTFGHEIKAGIITFLTLSYTIIINAQILGMAGVAPEDCILATTLSCALGSLVVGAIGNLPFGCGPGIGLSAYLAYGLVHPAIQTKQQGFASCLVVGLLVGLCALTGLGQRLLQLVPRAVKLGIIVGMGLQITLIGLKYAGLVVANETSLVALGDVYNSSVWVTLAGLVLTGTLLYFQVAGSLLIGVTLCTLCIWWVDGSWPDAIAQWPSVSTQVANTFDLTALTPGCIGGIAAMLLVELTDISGTAFGLGGLAGVMDRQGSVAREVWGSIGCGLATMLGALLGCSPINIGIESAAGIKQGGRTGLSAVVAGILFLVPAFFAPLLASVPQAATASTLILIGAVMMSESKNIAWSDMAHAIPAYITIMMMAFTFSVSNGIWFGMGSAGILYITTGDFLHRFPFQGQRRYSSFNQATSPLIDDTQGAVRHPALLISKDDADKYDIDTDEASKRQRFLS